MKSADRVNARPTCHNDETLMISAFDRRKGKRIWKCPTCGKEQEQEEPPPRLRRPSVLNEIEVEVPSVAEESELARSEVTMRDAGIGLGRADGVPGATSVPGAAMAGPTTEFEAEAEKRLKALLTTVPAHEATLDRMKGEAHALNAYLRAMGRPGMEIPWARPGTGPGLSCSKCGRTIPGTKRVRRDPITKDPICWSQPCDGVVLVGQ